MGKAVSVLCAGAFLLAAGCAERDVSREELELLTAEQIFRLGEDYLQRGEPDKAADTFDEIERLYPYSQWSKRATMMSAFSYHNAGEYEDSRSAAQRYLDFYPADDDAAYAQFLISLSYYDQIVDVGRDQGNTFEALQSLRATIERYPDSEYAQSARLKFDLTLDHLAGQEMEIGRYYLKRGHYVAGVNRFRAVIEEYQTTSHTPEALHRLVESYLSLGLTDEAQTAGAVLGHNYQATQWYSDSYALLTGQGLDAQEAGDSWLTSMYRQVVQGKWL
jgi:outer membrane protein assembly factor BamD